MTKVQFLRQEAQAARQFMDRWLFSDLKQPGAMVGYRREYRCECGYHCVDSAEIYDHALLCGQQPAQLPLLTMEPQL